MGSYFSVTDYVGPGADKAVIALPGLDLGDKGLTAARNPFMLFSRTSVAGAFGAVTAEDPDFLIAPRYPDHEPDDSGQWGIALRYLAEELNATEFGFYFMNYHSRLPVVSAHTGTAEDAGHGLVIAGTIGRAGQTAVAEIVHGEVLRALQAAGCPSPQASAECGALAQRVRAAAKGQLSDLVLGAVQAAGIDAYAKKGRYFIEYPEDIQLFGVSFNTEIGATGWALQGEWSYRRDAPLQFAEREVFADALAPFTGCLERSALDPAAGPACIGENTARGLYDADTVGYIRRGVSQIQATATKVFGPALGADGVVFVTEAALMRVHDMPSIPLESPAGGVLDTGEADADATSWGYRIAARLDYNNAIGGANLYPYAQSCMTSAATVPLPAARSWRAGPRSPSDCAPTTSAAGRPTSATRGTRATATS